MVHQTTADNSNVDNLDIWNTNVAFDDCEDDEDDIEEETSRKLGGTTISYDDVINKLKTPEMQAIKASIPRLNWPKLIRLMEYGDLTDEHVSAILDGAITPAQVLEKRKQFHADDHWNIGEYGTYITLFKRATSKRRVTTNAEGKPVQGTKIQDMWKSITEIPISQQSLMDKFGVSVHILKQYRRFIRAEWVPAGFKIERILAADGMPHFYLVKCSD